MLRNWSFGGDEGESTISDRFTRSETNQREHVSDKFTRGEIN